MTRKLTFAVLASVMLAACQKTDTAKSSEAFAIKTPSLITNARNFFDNNIATIQSKSPPSNKETSSRQQVRKTPLWGKASVVQDETKGEVVIVPLQYEKPLHFKASFGNGSTLSIEKQSNLWIYKDASGKYKAEVRITLPNKMFQEGIVKSFEGYILEEDWLGNSLNKYLYKNGKSNIVKENLPVSDIDNPTNKYIGECDEIDWYLCDYITQNGVGYNCQFLYTEYVNCDGGDDGDGGGGGDGYINNDFCTMTNEQAQASLNIVTTSIGSNGISIIGQQTAPDASGIIKKPVVVKRHSIKYTFPGGKTATYTLFFPGVIFKTTTNSVWKWSTEQGEALHFEKIERTAGSNPACLSASVSAIVSLVISTDKTKADFAAVVKADLQVSCLGGWIIKTKSDPIDGTYYAYEFQ